MTLARPWLLLLLLLIPVALFLRAYLRWRLEGGIGLATPPGLKPPLSTRAVLSRWLPFLRALALVLLVLALAGPRLGRTKVKSYSEGIDIVLALDISGSMRALDFPPGNRLEAAKKVASSFIEGRPGDRIGLVVFASNSYTQCPLTTDHEVLQRLLQEIKIGDIKDGTAVGMAIGNALNRLKEIPGKSRVITLLTDGMNNTGVLDPLTAAGLARALGVRIYTIGAGTKGKAPYPVEDRIFGRRVEYVEVDLDEETLQAIADSTGGLYFRATDFETLERIYDRIDALEKTRVETEEYVEYRDLGGVLLWPALALVLLEVLLTTTWLRRFP
ncbi:VWA domain-containing protein [Candidatus Eisenbacteria bacterium]|uniref:VWA domain-containing protein n=1 Tax=Eiseniibacteriota bacterium TaxID=2212470 RepID=A0ABV6YJB7_UNCEI